MTLPSRHPSAIILVGACVLLFCLWLPGLKYPGVSDTIVYGLLGREFWEHGRYWLLGAPFAKHLPLQAIVSYPFTMLLGLHVGMRVSSLVAGMGVLCITFALARERWGHAVARIAVGAVLLHPAFILMAQQGSADLLFAFLFLLTLLLFLRAGRDWRWYPALGFAAGALCLTRYNGLPVALFLAGWTIWKRRAHLRSPWPWTAGAIGTTLAGLWFARNLLAFGNPFHSEYTVELAAEAPNPLAQVFSNLWYYGNPVHNILPFLLPFSLWGIWKKGRSECFLIGAMLSAWVLTAIWWVPAIRFAYAGYVLLTLFAAVGIADVLGRARRHGMFLGAVLFAGFLAVQIPALCVYTYGECNAFVDRHTRVLPKNLGLTPEGAYAWHRAREVFNRVAESGALLVTENALTAAGWKEGGVLRSDVRVSETKDGCPYYRIVQEQNIHPAEEVLFLSEEAPRTAVTRFLCMQ